MGKDPPQVSGTSWLHCNLPESSGRRGNRRYLYGGFGFDCSLSTACPRVVTLTVFQTAGVFLCAHDYRAVRTVQAALQTAK